MRRSSLLIAALLALAPETALAAGEDPARRALRERFGVTLVDREAPEGWTATETAALVETLDSLPKDLQTLAHRTRFREIRLLKSVRPEELDASHIAPPLLFWQLELHIEPGMDEAAFKRLFVHHWLHVYDAHHQLSRAPEWRSLSGWRLREYFGVKLPFLPKAADNQDPRGYADDRGLRSPEEDFATFGELFFVTPDSTIEDSIACRTPEKYAYFRRLFPDYTPYLDQPHIRCRGVAEGFLDDLRFFDPITHAPLDLGPIDEHTVTGFELLYATPGVADAAEVAGHLVLRMKLANNPQAERLGIENPNDLVLSFLADTEADRPPRPPRAAAPVIKKECKRDTFLGLDLGLGHGQGGARGTGDELEAMRSVVQALKGLSGGFLTTFDRQTLWQAVKTYTVDQDRNLLRYRLNLTDEQKRRLIDRLYLAKKSYKTKYYFFDRNCASILVQLIGEGIGDDEIASFDPFVVPPNALVALLIRKGLATPVHPAFYSYRKKGLVAREMVTARLAEARAAAPREAWPDEGDVVAHDDAVRRRAFEQIEAVAARRPVLARTLYQLANFGQEAELAYTHKGEACQEVTSEATAVLRRMQRAILARDAGAAQAFRVDTNTLIHERLRPDEEKDSRTGSPHTALSSVHVGASNRGAVVGLALHRQEMGAMTTESMQRATSVVLGQAEATQGLRAWRASGLILRKFKERLRDVPGYLEEDGALGLGLTVLDMREDQDLGLRKTTLAGGELLANIASSRLYNRYVYASVGAAVDATRLATGGRRTHISLPVRLEGLWTFDDARRWQARGQAELRTGLLAGRVERETTGQAQLVYRLPQVTDSELLLCAGAGYHEYSPFDAAGRHPIWTLRIGMDWNRW